MSKCVVSCTWDDVPHLSAEAKEELWASIPAFQRDARAKGVPQLGSGAIYQVAEGDIVCAPFELPEHWKLVYGMDVGWNRTAAIWGAHDIDTDTVYLVSEWYRGQSEPAVHAQGIKARGEWIPGVIDPASIGSSQTDGTKLVDIYRGLGLKLTLADNNVESGIYAVWMRLSTGRLKVFSTCQNLLAEYRLYRRDESGKIVKQNDHLLDALRYLVASGLDLAAHRPAKQWAMARNMKRAAQISSYDPFAEMFAGTDRFDPRGGYP